MSESQEGAPRRDRTLLGLPLRTRRTTVAATVALAAYYLVSMNRSFSMYDSPELAMVAEQLGLGHPIGQPLHTILGFIVTHIGLDPLWALNALSAVAGALTLIPAVSFGEALLEPDPKCPRGLRTVVAPTIALAAVHAAVWEPATRIEVYALATFCCMWAVARLIHAMLDSDQRSSTYVVVGVALGLAACANAYFAVGTAFAIAPRLVIALARKEVPLRTLAWILPGGLAGLLPLAYAPIIARLNPDAVIWGNPSDIASLLHYFSGADFPPRQTSWPEFSASLGRHLRHAYDQGVVAFLLIGFIGYALYARQRGLGRIFFSFSTLFFFLLVATNSVPAPDVLDYQEYLSIPCWVAGAGFGLLVAAAYGRANAIGGAAIVALVVVIALSPPPPWARNRHLDRVTETISELALRDAPSNAIVIVETDHWAASFWYLQEQRALRPDVVTLIYGLTSSGWYWQHLYKRHPKLNDFDVHGPGGRNGRVRRFVDAQEGRPLRVESASLAASLERNPCFAPWLLGVRPHCGTPAEASQAFAHVVETAADRLQDGSPGTRGLLAGLAFRRGDNLQRIGRTREAVSTLLAPLGSKAPEAELDLRALPSRGAKPPLRAPRYDPPVAIGHPARNLHFAARIASQYGMTRLAEYLDVRAAERGPVSPKIAKTAD